MILAEKNVDINELYISYIYMCVYTRERNSNKLSCQLVEHHHILFSPLSLAFRKNYH